MTTPALPMPPALAARLDGSPLVLLLDIDGTLSPIAPRPELAIVPRETRRILDDLAAVPGVSVVFVTGRSAADGRRLTGVDAAWVIGNHGMEVAPPRKEPSARADVAPFEPRVAEAVAKLAVIADERGWSGVIVEDKRLTLSVHYRLADERIAPEIVSEVQRVAADLGLRVTLGKAVIELRPPIAVDKGTAALELIESLGARNAASSILAAGDDRTDEDLFRVLRRAHARAITVRVGDLSETEAEFSVSDTAEMHELLVHVLGARRAKVADGL
jgi:trehalose 6-phosphate phosphatase